MTTVWWEDPPINPPSERNQNGGRGVRPVDWRAVWVEVMAKPSTWALLHVADKAGTVQGMASRMRRRSHYRVPAGAWEFRGVLRPDGMYGLYARYHGPEVAS